MYGYSLKQLAALGGGGVGALVNSLGNSFLFIVSYATAATTAADQAATVEGWHHGTQDVQTSVVAVRRKPTSTTRPYISIGRTDENDVVIGDITVSKFHASVRESGGRVLLMDEGSRNGTFVNDGRLVHGGTATELMNGDSVRFGSVACTYIDAVALHSILMRS